MTLRLLPETSKVRTRRALSSSRYTTDDLGNYKLHTDTEITQEYH